MRTSGRQSENDRNMNGGKNDRPSTTSTAKTLVPCSLAFARVMLWELSTTVHSRVHVRRTIDPFSFLHHTPQYPVAFKGSAHMHVNHTPHVFVSMYA